MDSMNEIKEEINLNEENFIQWYTDMIENYPNTFVHYLSDDALFQWFGRSVRGPEKILYFIKTQMQGTKHLLNLSNSLDNRDNANINKNTFKNLIDESEISSCAKTIENTNIAENNGIKEDDIKMSIPTNLLERDDFACGDGPNIDKLNQRESDIGKEDYPVKKRQLTTNIFETKGAIEFTKPYYKRGVSETRWERPCKLKIGYSGNLNNPIDFNIQLIIYGDNMTCKKNLLPEFEKCLENKLD